MRSKSAQSVIQVFRGIGSLLTLAPAAQRGGRRVREEDLGEIPHAAIVAREGRIAWVGPEAELAQSPAAERGVQSEEIDLGGATVLPSFIECHTHMLFAGNRANEFELRNQGLSYQEIAKRGGGIRATVLPTRAASLQDLVESGQARADTFVRQGVTTIEVKSGYALETDGEFKLLEAANRIQGPRIVPTYLGPHAIPMEAGSAQEYIEGIIARDLPLLKQRGLASRVDIFIEQGYFSEELARPYLQMAKDLGFDLVIHADQLTHAGGARLAVEFGARSAEHLIRIDKSDVQRLSASETTCVLLPAADLYLKCPYPPARDLLDGGARVALATDFNPGTSPTQSVSLVGVLARLEMRMTLPEVLVAYTLNGAHALGLAHDLGSIQIGKYCDISTYDCDWKDLFYSIGESPVKRVWREGVALKF